MGGDQAMIVAGIGLGASCPAEDIVRVVQAAMQQASARISLMAAPDFKCDDSGLLQAADTLNVTLAPVSRAALMAVQARCVTRSARAEAATGIASVAEGSALAAAGPDGRLILPRIALGRATCALAEGPSA
jgi:cobalt-precorrin 5A hydrolase